MWYVSRYLKDELAWGMDKQFWLISNLKHYTSEELRNTTVLYCMHCYVVHSNHALANMYVIVAFHSFSAQPWYHVQKQ